MPYTLHTPRAFLHRRVKPYPVICIKTQPIFWGDAKHIEVDQLRQILRGDFRESTAALRRACLLNAETLAFWQGEYARACRDWMDIYHLEDENTSAKEFRDFVGEGFFMETCVVPLQLFKDAGTHPRDIWPRMVKEFVVDPHPWVMFRKAYPDFARQCGKHS